MRLANLAPRWFAESGRFGQGVVFRCPCCVDRPLVAGVAPAKLSRRPEQAVELAVAFANPLDGGAPFPIANQKALWSVLVYNVGDGTHPAIVPPGHLWVRVGESFESLALMPSVDASAAGHWHGFIVNGKIT